MLCSLADDYCIKFHELIMFECHGNCSSSGREEIEVIITIGIILLRKIMAQGLILMAAIIL